MNTCPTLNNNQLKRLRFNKHVALTSISSLNARIIDQNPIIFNHFELFSQQILGPKLSKLLHWQALLPIKTKYLFSKELHLELINNFKQIENEFYQKKDPLFSLREKILISCMRAFASWDIDVSVLVVDVCLAFLDSQMRTLFLQSLIELSARALVVIIDHDDLGSEGSKK